MVDQPITAAAAAASRSAAREDRPEATRTIEGVGDAFRSHGYIADRGLATSVFLALRLGKPLFLEGEAGVGKTEIAKVLAAVPARPLIRLQCYEGLDLQSAVYEWNYARQILEIRLLEARGEGAVGHLHDVFTREFLLRRPLLEAIDRPPGERSPVLLIDELDRADEEFEAYLLELLSDFQITIPELGTIRAAEPPVVVITSNRTREIHDALKRRCLYQWIDYPDFEKEIEIVRRSVTSASERLAREVVAFVQDLRREELFKRPGVAETLDWIMALQALDRETLSDEIVGDTLGVLLKYQDDIRQVRGATARQFLADQEGPGFLFVATQGGRPHDVAGVRVHCRGGGTRMRAIRVWADGASLADACALGGCSRATLFRWRDRFDDGGLAGSSTTASG